MSNKNIPNYQQDFKNDEIDFLSFLRILIRNKKYAMCYETLEILRLNNR